MFGIGSTELLIVLVIVLVLFGGSRVAQLGHGLGKGIREFKKGLSGDDDKTADKSADQSNEEKKS